MIIQLYTDINPQQKEKLHDKINGINYRTTELHTQSSLLIVCTGTGDFDIRSIGRMDGVKDVHRVSDSFKLVSRKWKVHPTEIDLKDGVVVNDKQLSIIAGPCSIESEEQVEKIVNHLVENNVKIMRGGVFKPRSSPYAFRGLGLDGLKMFYNICHANNIKIVTEVMEITQIEQMYDYVDVFQVGARNSQNFNLLDELGKIDKPVLLKRGISGTIDELVNSAEYIFSKGNEKLMLCERGIRTYENAYRNTFDINAIPILKSKTHLPVLADPSHGIGLREFVPTIAIVAVAAGANGILYEVHEKPEEAYSDGQQTLDFHESKQLIENMRKTYQSLC